MRARWLTNTWNTPSGFGRLSATQRAGCTRRLKRGRRLLFEGAQGSLLGYRSRQLPLRDELQQQRRRNCRRARACPTRHIDRWIGIAKAYTTRVGGGPFPTEQNNAIGERIRRIGNEYGTVTGRPRRCGWFDAVAVRYAARISGSTELAVMLLDVLSGIDALNVAVAYDFKGKTDRTSCPARLPTSNSAARSTRRCRAGTKISPRSKDGQTFPREHGTTSSSWAGKWGCQ